MKERFPFSKKTKVKRFSGSSGAPETPSGFSWFASDAIHQSPRGGGRREKIAYIGRVIHELLLRPIFSSTVRFSRWRSTASVHRASWMCYPSSLSWSSWWLMGFGCQSSMGFISLDGPDRTLELGLISFHVRGFCQFVGILSCCFHPPTVCSSNSDHTAVGVHRVLQN